MRPHRRQPTRLPRPWDSPGKNTGLGCHFLLQCMKGKSESEVDQLCPTLHDRMVCSLPGSSVHGIFQARVLEWGAIAFSNRQLTSIFTYSFFNVLFYYGLSQDTENSLLCYTSGPCCWPTLNATVFIHQPQIPSPVLSSSPSSRQPQICSLCLWVRYLTSKENFQTEVNLYYLKWRVGKKELMLP